MTEFLPLNQPVSDRLRPITRRAALEWAESWNRYVGHRQRCRAVGDSVGAWPVADAWPHEPRRDWITFEPLVRPQKRDRQADGAARHPWHVVLRLPRRWDRETRLEAAEISEGGWFSATGFPPDWTEILPPPAWKSIAAGAEA